MDFGKELHYHTPKTWLEDEENFCNQLKDTTLWGSVCFKTVALNNFISICISHFKVPLLNVLDINHTKNASLVRFRGMVQDMYDPEYYYEKYEVVNSETKTKSLKNGKYTDTAQWEVWSSSDNVFFFIIVFVFFLKAYEQFNAHSDSNLLSERNTFVVVSAPGKNAWVENVCLKKLLNAK